jgi:hypothetical protein
MIVACSILEHKGTHETVEEPHIFAVGLIIHIVIALDKAIRLWLEM